MSRPASRPATDRPPHAASTPAAVAQPAGVFAGRAAQPAGADALALAPRMAAQRAAIAAIHGSPRALAQRAAVQRLQDAGAGAQAGVAQREPVPYDTSYKGALSANKGKVDQVVDELDKRVMAAYDLALNWRTLEGHPDAMVRRWHEAAQAYAHNPEIEPGIIYARFGYAIESLACAGLNNSNLHGLTMQIQVSHGHTRPDVVASAGGHEVLWLDITSEGSIGHILGKDSSSWSMRPFVYEIPYPKLSLRALLDATDDPYYQELGGFLADEKQVEGDVKEARRTTLRDRLINLRREQRWTTGTGNAADKRRATRDFFMADAASEGVEEDTASMANTRGALEALGINPGPFGFNRGDVGSRIERLNQVVDAASEEEIDVRKGQLAAATSMRLIAELKGKIPEGLHAALEEEFYTAPGARIIALTAMALKGVVADMDSLRAARDKVSALDQGDARAGKLKERMQAQLDGPASVEMDTLLAWRRGSKELVREGAALEQVQQANKALHDYTVRAGIGFFNRPENITKAFQGLAAAPPNAQLAKEVIDWVGKQP